MKKQAFRIIVALSLFGMLAGLSVYAQDLNDEIDVNIPFKFTVENTTLPPGKYIIRRVFSDDPQALTIQSANFSVAVDFLTNSAETEQTPNKTHLLFNEVGNRYFLSQIWTQGENIGSQLSPSRAELRLEKLAAKQGTKAVMARHLKRHAAQTASRY
jgi:hypothetical protein